VKASQGDRFVVEDSAQAAMIALGRLATILAEQWPVSCMVLQSHALAVDKMPSLESVPIASFPVRELGVQRETRVYYKVERALVVKSNVDCVVLAGGKELNEIYGFAFNLFHPIEGASGKATNVLLRCFDCGA
jgi:hypothetical protein